MHAFLQLPGVLATDGSWLHLFREWLWPKAALPCPRWQPSRVNTGENGGKRLVLRPSILSYLGWPTFRDPSWDCYGLCCNCNSHITSLVSLPVLFLSILPNKPPASNSLGIKICFCEIHLKQWPCQNTFLINHITYFFLLSLDKSQGSFSKKSSK